MTTIINHDVRVVNGSTLYMPPWVEDQSKWGNLALPDLSVVDATQKYPIGTKFVEGDRVYRYALAGGAITKTSMGVKNGLVQGVAQRVVAVAAKGATSVTVTCAPDDGALGTGTIVENEFAGGYILFFTVKGGGYDQQVRLITGNTSGTTSIVFTLNRGLGIALDASTSKVEAMASPYKHVVLEAGRHFPVVGIPTVLASQGEYLWLQTWGIIWVSPQTTVGVGGNTGVFFRHDGSLEGFINTAGDLTADSDATTQYAGYCIAGTIDATQGAPFFMLQISP